MKCMLRRYSFLLALALVFLLPCVDLFYLPAQAYSSDYDYWDADYDVSEFWWDVIERIRDADDGDSIRVNIGSRATVPTPVLYELQDLRVMLVLRPSSGNNVYIYGRDIDYISSSREYYSLGQLSDRYYDGYDRCRNGDYVAVGDSVRTGTSVISAPEKSNTGGLRTSQYSYLRLVYSEETPVVIIAPDNDKTAASSEAPGIVIATDDQVSSAAPKAPAAQQPAVSSQASSSAQTPKTPDPASSSSKEEDMQNSSSSEAPDEQSSSSRPPPVMTGGNSLPKKEESKSSSSESSRETSSKETIDSGANDIDETASAELSDYAVSFPVFITVVLVLAGITLGSLTFAVTTRMRHRGK